MPFSPRLPGARPSAPVPAVDVAPQPVSTPATPTVETSSEIPLPPALPSQPDAPLRPTPARDVAGDANRDAPLEWTTATFMGQVKKLPDGEVGPDGCAYYLKRQKPVDVLPDADGDGVADQVLVQSFSRLYLKLSEDQTLNPRDVVQATGTILIHRAEHGASAVLRVDAPESIAVEAAFDPELLRPQEKVAFVGPLVFDRTPLRKLGPFKFYQYFVQLPEPIRLRVPVRRLVRGDDGQVRDVRTTHDLEASRVYLMRVPDGVDASQARLLSVAGSLDVLIKTRKIDGETVREFYPILNNAQNDVALFLGASVALTGTVEQFEGRLTLRLQTPRSLYDENHLRVEGVDVERVSLPAQLEIMPGSALTLTGRLQRTTDGGVRLVSVNV